MCEYHDDNDVFVTIYYLFSSIAITITNARWLFLTQSLQKLGQYLGKLISIHYKLSLLMNIKSI